MFLSFLLNNKSFIAIALLITAIAGEYVYITILKTEKETLIAEKIKIDTLLTVSQSTVKQLQSDITSQNDAVEKWKKDADIRAAKNAEEIKNAQKAAGTYAAKAEELLRMSIPQNMSVCDASNLIINQEIKNAKK